MQILPNHYYRTRDGRRAYVNQLVSSPFSDSIRAVGFVEGGDSAHEWRVGGQYWGYGDGRLDLIAPWVDPPQEVTLPAKVYPDGKITVDFSALDACHLSTLVLRKDELGNIGFKHWEANK